MRHEDAEMLCEIDLATVIDGENEIRTRGGLVFFGFLNIVSGRMLIFCACIS